VTSLGASRRPLLRAAAIVALVAASLLGPAGASPVLAADDGLTLASTSSYGLVPDKGLVHVTVDVTATNNKANLVQQVPGGTRITRYIYDSAAIAVQSEATGIRAAGGKRALTTKVTPADGYSRVQVNFRGDLQYQQVTSFRVEYDLPGGAPRSDSDIRVGSAFATFYVWAFGDRGDVSIVIPAGFEVETSGSTVAKNVKDGVTTLTATGIADPTEWYAVVVADRHDSLTQDRLDLKGGEHVVVRAWPEDVEWRTRVRDLLRLGLPVLVDKIGLDWPVEGDIEVAEVHTPLLEGYAGVYYTAEDRIEISEDLDELTIVHEASHAWFNPDLFVGRWINEGFADEYASRVLDEVSVGGLGPDTVTPTSKGAIELNLWTHPGRIADEKTDEREHFGYEASWTVVRTLLDEIGEESMRAVLAAARANETAYRGAGKPETVAIKNDWRRFLDLLEEAGGSDGAEDVFRNWIVSDEQVALLDARRDARAAYASLLDASKGWQPGYAIRDPLGRWEFGRATTEIGEASSILALRDEIATHAAELSVAPPTTLRVAYEGATDGLESVRSLAETQLATATDLDAAAAKVAAERDVFASIGLIGEDPGAGLAAASAAFSAGDTAVADAGADSVVAVITGAADAGRTRMLVGGLAGVGVIVLGAGGVFAVYRRRRQPLIRPMMTWGAAPSPGESVTSVTRGPSASVDDRAAAAALRTSALLAKFRAEPTATLPDPPNQTDPYATLGGPRPPEAVGDSPAEPEHAEGDDR
jgi:hypothetical protein